MDDIIVPAVRQPEYTYNSEDKPIFYSRQVHAWMNINMPRPQGGNRNSVGYYCFDQYIKNYYNIITTDFYSLSYGKGKISEGYDFTKMTVIINMDDYGFGTPYSSGSLENGLQVRHFGVMRANNGKGTQVNFYGVTNTQVLGAKQIQYSLELDKGLYAFRDNTVIAHPNSSIGARSLQVIRTHKNRFNLSLTSRNVKDFYFFDFTPTSNLYLTDPAVSSFVPLVGTSKSMVSGISRAEIIQDSPESPKFTITYELTPNGYSGVRRNLIAEMKYPQSNFITTNITFTNNIPPTNNHPLTIQTGYAYAILSYNNNDSGTQYKTTFKGDYYPFIVVPIWTTSAFDTDGNRYYNLYNHPNLVNIILTPFYIYVGDYITYDNGHSYTDEDLDPLFVNLVKPKYLIKGDNFFNNYFVSSLVNNPYCSLTTIFAPKPFLGNFHKNPTTLAQSGPVRANGMNIYGGDGGDGNTSENSLTYLGFDKGIGNATVPVLNAPGTFENEPKIYMSPHYNITFQAGLREKITGFNELIWFNALKTTIPDMYVQNLYGSSKGIQLLLWENLFKILNYGTPNPLYNYYTNGPSIYLSLENDTKVLMNYYDLKYTSETKYLIDGSYIYTSMSNGGKNYFENNISSFQTSKETVDRKLAIDSATAVPKAIAGGVGGALAGAGIGSIVPGIGTALGAIIGAILGTATGAGSAAMSLSNDVMQRKQFFSQLEDLARAPESLRNSISKDSVTDIFGNNKTITVNEMTDANKTVVAGQYHRYGYLIDGQNQGVLLQDIASLTENRYLFNFGQIHNFYQGLDLKYGNQVIIDYLNKIFEDGIRLGNPIINSQNKIDWDIYNFSIENGETDICEDQGGGIKPGITQEEQNVIA